MKPQFFNSMFYFLYIIFGIFFYYFSRGDLYTYTSDFDFYHSYAHNLLGTWASSLSNDLYFTANSIRLDWIPSPVYSTIFLLPITLFGSKFLFFVQGIIIGLIIIKNLFLSLVKINPLLNKVDIFIILFLAILFPSFLIETITSSTNSVLFLFVILALNSNTVYKRIIYFSFAALIRPNLIILIISIIISIAIFKPKGFKTFFIQFIPVIIIYLISYKYIYSGYPGSVFNYLFMSYGQAINSYHDYSQKLFSDLIDKENIETIFYWNGNFFDSLKLLFSSQEVFSYTFNIVITKLFLTLGFLQDNLITTTSGLWFIKIWRTLYFLFISLPGFYISFIAIFMRKYSLTEKSIFLSAIIFLIFNSSLIGGSKYFVGTHFVFIYVLYTFLKEIYFINKSLKSY